MKKYYDHYADLTPDKVLKGLVKDGLFSDQLPPIFQSNDFFSFVTKITGVLFAEKPTIPVSYLSTRNTNIPRALSIPNPFSHYNLSNEISSRWADICLHMNVKTAGDSHKISRIHIRSINKSDAIFKMNYKNYRTDDSAESDLLIGSRYIVKADISTCFPSIYTHSIPWAFVGKEIAKQNKNNKVLFYNRLDRLVALTKENETHGILIGPHTSNIISEIVLTSVDNILSLKKYRFVRYIDDYRCYCKNIEEADVFLVDLENALKDFGLLLNHKKTSVLQLPVGIDDEWTKEIKLLEVHIQDKVLNYRNVEGYFDLLISLSKKNNYDMSIVNYGLKALCDKKRFSRITDSARKLLINLVSHTTIIHPYLIRNIEEFIFIFLNMSSDEIREIVQQILDATKNRANYEIIAYCYYFSLKYSFALDLGSDIFSYAKDSNDTIVLLMTYLYNKKNGYPINEYYDYAKYFHKIDPLCNDKHWIFVYEVLNKVDLKNDWKLIKKSDVSFIKPEFR